MSDTSEAKVQKRIILALSQAFWPGVFWRQNAGKVKTRDGYWVELGPDGIADIVGFMPHGPTVFVECKRRLGKQRESQAKWQKAAEAAGAIYVVARDPERAVKGVLEAKVRLDEDLRQL